jgi:uncharacterized protein YbaR (Trm112 family)
VAGHSRPTTFGVDAREVDLQCCPYDGTPVETIGPGGASCVLTCATCRAQWEVRGSIPVRMVEPDWDVIGPVTEWQPEATLVTSRLVRALKERFATPP